MLKINDMKWFEQRYEYYGFVVAPLGYSHIAIPSQLESETSICNIFVAKETGHIYIYYKNHFEPIVALDELFELPSVLFDLIKAEKIEKEGE